MVTRTAGRVLVIGSINTDLVCRVVALPRAGETVRGLSFATYAGGKGANQAVAAARAGARVTFVGAVGADAFGAARRADLANDDIDVSRLINVPMLATGTALIVVDACGENQIVVASGANDAIDVTAACEAVSTVAHDVLSLTLETPFHIVETLLRRQTAGVRTVLNAAPFDTRVGAVLPFVDVLICNEVEAASLLGGAVVSDGIHAARGLRELGPRVVIVTLGAAGAACATNETELQLGSPRVTAVDATGAGDAFCGAFTTWLAEGRPVAECMQAGIVAGALAVTRHGAQASLPRRVEVLEMLASVDGI